jgi:hypothetical protein
MAGEYLDLRDMRAEVTADWYKLRNRELWNYDIH